MTKSNFITQQKSRLHVTLLLTVRTCWPRDIRLLNKGIVFCAGDGVVPLVEIVNKSVVVAPSLTDVHH